MQNKNEYTEYQKKRIEFRFSVFTGKIKQVNSCPFCKQETLELENKEYGGNMELLKPDYYDEFTCIADKCTISCCREWKINIDDETYRNWKTIQPPSEVPRTQKLPAGLYHEKGWQPDHEDDGRARLSFSCKEQTVLSGKCLWGFDAFRDLPDFSKGDP